MVSPLNSIIAGGRAPNVMGGLGDLIRKQSLTDSSLKTQGLQQERMQQQIDQANQPKQMSPEQSLDAARYLNSLGKQLLSTDESQWGQILGPNIPQLQQMGYTPEMLRGMTREQVQGVVDQTEPLMGNNFGEVNVQSSESLPGGITKMVTRDGQVIVKDASGQELKGQDAITKLKAAEDRQAKLAEDESLGRARGGARGQKVEVREQDAIAQGIAAAPTLVDVNRGLELLDKIETGGLTAKSKAVSAFFGSTSGDVGELNKILAQDMLNTIQQFPGSLSEGELNVINSISASLSQGAEVNRRILSRLKQVLNTKIKRARRLAEDKGDIDAIEAIEESLSFGGQRSQNRQEPQAEAAPASISHPQFGDVTEEDIQETMRANNMTREQVLARLQGG